MRVTMTNPARSEDGLSILLSGSTYTVSDQYGMYLVRTFGAIDTDGTGPFYSGPDQLSASQVAALRSLVSGAWILNGATAGQDSGWLPLMGGGFRLAYALDSGSVTTTFAVDISGDGITSLAQAFTGTWASSTSWEDTGQRWVSNINAKFFRFSVLAGGPLSVRRIS